MFLKFLPWILLGLMVLGIVGYYYDSQGTIRELTEKNVGLQVALDTEKQKVELLNKNAELQSELRDHLTTEKNQSELKVKELEAKLRRHNLSELARSKPELIEKRINDGSKKVLDELENLSKPKTAGTPQ